MRKNLLVATLAALALGLTSCGEKPVEPTHEHSLTFHSAVAGTCQTEGTIAYYDCACGKKFSDAEGAHEITSIKGELGSHKLGEVVEYAEPTCTTAGHYAYQECEHCHTKFDEEGHALATVEIPAKGHAYKYELTKAPTTEAEGEVKRTCPDCDEPDAIFKVLPLPVLSIDGKVMTVAPVEGATGYKLVRGENVEALELDEEGKFTLTQKMLQAPYLGVRAVKDDAAYMEVGYTPINFRAVGENIQSNTNWNFEANRTPTDLVIGANTQWNVASPYGNFSGFDWWMIQETEDNMCAKILPRYNASGANVTGILKDLGSCNGANDYIVSFDVKLSEEAYEIRSAMAMDVYFNNEGTTVRSKGSLSLAAAKTTDWYHLSFFMDSKPQSAWTQLSIMFATPKELLGGRENAYVLVDNIAVAKASEPEVNVDSLGGPGAGTFSNWDRMGAVHAATGVSTNKVDWQFNGTIFVEGSSAGYISIIDETDTNRAIKVWNPKECSEWDLVGNANVLKTAGVYHMEFDVKLGSESKLRDLGLRAWSAEGQAIDDYVIDISSLKVGEWVTLSFNFTTNTRNTSWINLFFWSFADNNLADSFSMNNYFLFDNISIYRTVMC